MYFLGLFELLSLLFKQFNAFKAYILLLHMFSQFVTLTRVRVRVMRTFYPLSLTYVISAIVTKVLVWSNLRISGCELKENYYI